MSYDLYNNFGDNIEGGSKSMAELGSKELITDHTVVTDGIRQAILGGDFAPNQRMVEADLCMQFHASRSAVRAALQELGAQGLIERVANRGARVRSVSLDEAVEITEVRMVVEGLCAARAARNVTDADIAEFTDLRRAIAESAAAGDVFGYSRQNQLLHRRIREISAQRSADEILERLRGQLVRHQFKLAMHPGRMSVSLPEHVAIIDAVCARDSDAAEAAMRAHLRSVITALREVAAAR
ncbi:GntR family transcriptional regulator [Rhodococcus sp. 14-2470-1a]|uniref:GntR family transcriptional regulator n=1 Tax=Rhodococcus sp. 14-2470-1a TaxID=2023150 RepID=UPI00211AFA61|nr:GntR family transcriptional regulator [Rhodococcus sp. 14-2470-1a]